jgi:hypothetical protein
LGRKKNRQRYSLARYYPSSPNILRRRLSASDGDFVSFGSHYPTARGYVEAILPGYSRDGREALFFFRLGPTEHGAFGCYYLKKLDGRWEIALKRIYYLS